VFIRGAQPQWGTSKLALDLRIDGAAGFASHQLHDAYGLGGAGIGLRYRASRHVAFERASISSAAATTTRTSASSWWAAPAASSTSTPARARRSTSARHARRLRHAGHDGDFTPITVSYAHLGGYAGLGLEIFATRRIAFHVDARGVVASAWAAATAGRVHRSADGPHHQHSGGLVGSAGMLFYF